MHHKVDSSRANLVLLYVSILSSSLFVAFDWLTIKIISAVITLEHVVRRTRSCFGDRTLAAAGPQVWNSLPPNL